MNDLLAYLFRDSQLESEAEATREAIEQIMEEAEEQEPLKSKQTPLLKALKTLGLGDLDSEIQYDPEGFSLRTDDESTYRDWTRLLMQPDAMEKLAEMGWVVTRCGDKAQSNEPPEFRVRFLEIHFVNNDEQEPDRGSWPSPNPELVKKSVEKGREFMSTPLDRDHDELNPVEHPEAPNKKHAGMKDAKDGKQPEGKPKTGKSKSEALLSEAKCRIKDCDGKVVEGAREKYGPGFQGLCKRHIESQQDREERTGRHSATIRRIHGQANEASELVDSLLDEGGHAAGCQCGFCKNKGSFGKKKKDDTEEKAGADSEGDSGEDSMGEGIAESDAKCPKCHSTDTVTDEGKQHLCRTCGFEFVPVAQEAYERPVSYVDKSGKERQTKWVTKGKPKVESEEPARYDDVFEAMAKKNKGVGKTPKPGKVPKAIKDRRIK